MNQVALIGRLVKEPELVEVGDKKTPYIKNTIAVDDDFSKDKTHFFVFTLWQQSAEYLSRYAHKGDLIALTGSLEYNQWKDTNGENRSEVRVKAVNVNILSSKKEQVETTEPKESTTPVEEIKIEFDDDELPF